MIKTIITIKVSIWGVFRSIDFLTRLDEFNGKDVLVTGGSQGGALTMVTAGLSERVTATAAFLSCIMRFNWIFKRKSRWMASYF